MMKTLFGLVFNRWVLLAVLLLAASLVVWIVGPLVAIAEARPLDSERARWIAIALMWLLAATIVAWRQWRAKRNNTAVMNQLIAAPPAAKGSTEAAESADLQAVRQRFETALQTLRRARFGAGGLVANWSAKLNGRYLYELPWYLIIGAPGSGKTTALQNCGLKFPLAGKMGDHAVRGVGGTRHCDWWFTDRAVLIDTAGRFTTQDSDRENDRATWSGFLAMLKRSRPRQPVNGVLVTVSVVDLLTQSASERRQYADRVRQRLQELHEQLGIRFPIYLLVTKSDLLAGFMDYFATLDKDQRATPWGSTFKLDAEGSQMLPTFGREFDALVQRLNDGLVERLQGEPDGRRRASIYGFSGQFAGMRAPMLEFLDAAFSPSPYEPEPLLRGAYFVSGTQEGTPIDRVLGAIARSHQLERTTIPPNQSSGKSYFLSRLLGEVVFAESGLAGTNLRWERRRAALAIGGYAAAGLLTVGSLTAWTVSYVNNRRYVDEVAQRVEQVRQLVAATPNRASADLLPITPALAATRGLAGGDAEVPWSRGFGLYQGPKLDSAARMAYERMLQDAVLPRLGLRVEEQLRQPSDTPESQYEALKAYLMLHDTEHFDAPALKTYFEGDWAAQYGRGLEPAQREQLSQHLDELMREGAAVSPLPMDKELVEFHRKRLAATPLPQRVYTRLRHAGLGAEFTEFNAVKAAGSNASLVFTRASGEPMTRGVPGLFTYEGYHQGFQKAVPEVAQQLADEQGWVLNIADAPLGTPGNPPKLRVTDPLLDDVRRLYLSDYVAAWEGYIADLRLQPLSSVSQSIQMARLLSAADSPLPPLMTAISRETTLLAPPKNLLDRAATGAQGAVGQLTEQLAGTLTGKKAETGPRIESLVDDRFRGLRRLVTAPPGAKAPMDEAVALIGEVHVLLNAVDTAVKGGAALPQSPVPLKVKSSAASMPEPLHAMMESFSQASGQLAMLLVRQNLSNEVKALIGEFCQQAAGGRYPFERSAASDVTQADFGMLFGPGGKIDQFVQQKLLSYVDTNSRPWKFRALETGSLGNDAGTLPQFQRAQTIRETFFPNGNQPSLRLQFKPIEMDPTLKQFILDVDGQVVRYDHGPQIPATVQWPGPRGTFEVRMQVNPPLPGGGNTMLLFDGPWALFRLFDRVKVEPTNAPERVRATFDVDGRKALFEVTASSVRNPFRLRELGDFSCPMGL